MTLPAVATRPALRWLCAALLLCLGTAIAQPPPAPEGDIADLQLRMADGALSSVELVETYVARIQALDRAGPELGAIIELNPEALARAAALDEERARQGPRGPLHGIPVVIKDNIDTADAMLTTAGSLALIDSHPQRDAYLVERLREAGAVILGKTNLSEWANFRSTRSTSGWSARGGQTRNPWDPARNPCGSSSGSAVAVAAGFAVAAIGTETDGSIVCPSSVTGIVGFKPTLGLVSRSGIVPIAASQDTAGPMARSVADAALLLDAIAGVDPRDPATAALAGAPSSAAALGAEPAPLAGARIGVARDLAGFDARVDALLAHTLDVLRAAGAEVIDDLALGLPEQLGEDEYTVLLYEFRDGLERYLATRDGGPRTLSDIIAFNRREAERELAHFGQEILLAARDSGPLTDTAYLHARERARRAAGAQGIDALLRAHRLDAILAPTTGPAWLTDLVLGDHYSGGRASQAPAVAGYPHVTLPAGQIEGLPVGMSLFAGHGDDARLLTLAAALEAVLPPAPQRSTGAAPE